MRISTFVTVTTVTLLLLAGKVYSADGTVSVQRAVQDNVVLAKAYRCDANSDEIVSNDPLEKGTKIRICVATHLRAKLRGLTITKIANFHFLKEQDDRANIEQILLQNGIETNDFERYDETTFNCQPGSDLCYFESKPFDDFFDTDGTVLAIGNIMLQYGKYDSPNSLRGSDRKMVHTEDTTELLGTLTTVEMSFSVGDGNEGRDFMEHWENSPDSVKVLYIAGLVFALLILAGVCTFFFCWASFCSCIKTSEKEDDEQCPPSVSISKDDQSGTFVGDDDSVYVGPGSKAKPRQGYVRKARLLKVREAPSLQPKKKSTAGRKRKPRKANLGGRQRFVSRPPKSVKKVERKRTPWTADVGRNDSNANVGDSSKRGSMRWLDEKKKMEGSTHSASGHTRKEGTPSPTSKNEASESRNKIDLPKRKQHEDGKTEKKPGSMRGSTHSAPGPTRKEGTPSLTSENEAHISRSEKALPSRKVSFAMEKPKSEKVAESKRNSKRVN
jgi:hypothetical protein